MTYTCPVCGFDQLDEPAYTAAGEGLFEICPSCGFQFGVTDDDLGIGFHEWRQAWIVKGMPWSSKGRPAPAEWDPQEQLRRLEASGTHNLANESLLES